MNKNLLIFAVVVALVPLALQSALGILPDLPGDDGRDPISGYVLERQPAPEVVEDDYKSGYTEADKMFLREERIKIRNMATREVGDFEIFVNFALNEIMASWDKAKAQAPFNAEESAKKHLEQIVELEKMAVRSLTFLKDQLKSDEQFFLASGSWGEFAKLKAAGRILKNARKYSGYSEIYDRIHAAQIRIQEDSKRIQAQARREYVIKKMLDSKIP